MGAENEFVLQQQLKFLPIKTHDQMLTSSYTTPYYHLIFSSTSSQLDLMLYPLHETSYFLLSFISSPVFDTTKTSCQLVILPTNHEALYSEARPVLENEKNSFNPVCNKAVMFKTPSPDAKETSHRKFHRISVFSIYLYEGYINPSCHSRSINILECVQEYKTLQSHC